MSAYDYLNEGMEIAEQFRKEGKRDWANKIDSAISGGATSTEIMLALRHHLQQFLEKGEVCTSRLYMLIQQSAQQLDNLLNH